MDFFLTLVSISVPIFYALIIIDLIRLILFNVYIWQRKEYRWDRIVSFIHTEEGKRFLANPFVILKWIVFILFFFSPLYLPSLTILFFLLTQFIIVVNLFFGFKKIKNFPNLVVIGITGSFGKTTTKEFLATIVSQKYRVLKTEGTNNTEIG